MTTTPTYADGIDAAAQLAEHYTTGAQAAAALAVTARLARQVAADSHADVTDPADLFAKLVREVDAGRALLAMTTTPEAKRRAAADALALARDVLEDAREQLQVDELVQLDGTVVTAVSWADQQAAADAGAQLEADDHGARARSALERGMVHTFPHAVTVTRDQL